MIRIDGRDSSIGRLPGARLHRRHLIKYAAPVVAVEFNRNQDGPLPAAEPDESLHLTADGLVAITTTQACHDAQVIFEPPLPDLAMLTDHTAQQGKWHIAIDDRPITGGTWQALPKPGGVDLDVHVHERWKPDPLPFLMRIVTQVVPVFRQWPTTYRWHAHVDLDPAPRITSRWWRTDPRSGDSYRRATGS